MPFILRAGLSVIASVMILPPGPAQAALFDDLGGTTGVARIADRATDRFIADPRIAITFDGIDLDQFRRNLADQLCQVADGGCAYTGRDMATAHRGLNVTQAQFNALAEDLQGAMQASGVSYHVQNRLLARLAPMQRDVVSR